ncbi:hypothetical protein MHN79_10920 [Vibrio sp. Of14-4]|uniref:hypothetical protein n=1 Tax=Vibrio sp. Of14-4 TaxID=2724878 RepID=UPI001EF3319F|nr:hypothetical protein [Vibrio sp. Of14-4]MCG7490002.1 hypothetical protein [Vibrio sp. Of14-4]
MKYSGFFFLLALSTFSSIAGSCKNCKVASIGTGPYYGEKCIDTNDCAVVKVSGGNLTRASCNNYTAWHYVLDLSTETGKAAYSQLTVAYTTGALVTIHGRDSCESYKSSGGIEDFLYMYYTQ